MKFRFEVLLTTSSFSANGALDILRVFICTRWVEVACLSVYAPKRAKAIAIAIAISTVTDFSWNKTWMSSIFLKDVLTACLPAFSVLDRAESVYTVQKLVFHRAAVASVTQAIFMIGLAKASHHNYYDCRGNFHGECAKHVGPAILFNMLSLKLVKVRTEDCTISSKYCVRWCWETIQVT